MITYTIYGEVEETTKLCLRCGETKPVYLFRLKGEGKTVKSYYSHCISCEKKYADERKTLHRNATTKPDACDCCGKITNKLVLDHCHQTGRFRGWLCGHCNKGIGMLGDTVKVLRMALEYLERFEKS